MLSRLNLSLYKYAFFLKQCHCCLVLLNTSLPSLILIACIRFSVGTPGKIWSGVLKGVLRRHFPSHDLVLGDQLDPLSGLITPQRTHVVPSFVRTLLRWNTCLVSDPVEPWSDAIVEEGYLTKARSICQLHQFDKPVPLAWNQPSVVLVGLRRLLRHCCHVV